MRAAQAEIRTYVKPVKDRFGQLKVNPACAIEQDGRREPFLGFDVFRDTARDHCLVIPFNTNGAS